jgi:hypothetical protein|eukprot:COSAG01_NODE_8052_length_2938_cov_53.831631_3_plen_128_part_00
MSEGEGELVRRMEWLLQELEKKEGELSRKSAEAERLQQESSRLKSSGTGTTTGGLGSGSLAQQAQVRGLSTATSLRGSPQCVRARVAGNEAGAGGQARGEADKGEGVGGAASQRSRARRGDRTTRQP